MSQKMGPQLKVSSDRLVEPVASLGKILSKTPITKLLISLRICAGWSAAMLLTKQVSSHQGPDTRCVNSKDLDLID